MRQQKFTIGKYFVLFALMVCGLQLNAREIRFEDSKIKPKANTLLLVADDHYYLTVGSGNSNWSDDFDYRKINGWIKLKAHPHYQGEYIDEYKAKVSVEIKKYNPGSILYSQETKSLTVGYSPDADGNISLDNEFLNEFQINLSGTPLRFEVKVISTEIDGVITTDIPPNLELIAGVDVDRYHNFNPLEIPSISSHSITPQQIDQGKELEVYWDEVLGAESYELEWAFVDNIDFNESCSSCSGASFAYKSPATIELTETLFKNNATRVQISNALNYYKIPLIYPTGYLVYRVRAIGQVIDGTPSPYKGPGVWSSSGTVKNYVSDWGPNYAIVNGNFQQKKAKQIELAFIEHGRRKEVVTYFDGTGRDRQVVTRSEHISDTISVVGESIYDYLGRKVIDFLPAPVYDNDRYANTIAYSVNFNQNNLGTAYRAIDFDLDNTSDPCSPAAVESSNLTNGASKYYGSEFALEADPNTWNRFVPDAEGWPFSVREYTRDNTGRLKTQGGVGEAFQIGPGRHYTRSFYGSPDQNQLIALFGSEIGDKKFYRKQMNVDPNGQASFVYTDYQGRTIATSLAGSSPPQLSSLATEPSNPEIVTSDLLGNLSQADLEADPELDESGDSNLLSGDGMSLDYTGSYLNTVVQNDLHLNYEIETTYYQDDCTPGLKFPYHYVLDANVFDGCQISMIPGTGDPFPALIGPSGEDVSSTFSFDDVLGENQLPEIGEYAISKSLAIDEDVMYEHLDNFIEAALEGPCYQNSSEINTILENAGESVLDMSCFESCEACSTYVANSTGLSQEEIDYLYEDCSTITPCNDPPPILSLCDNMYSMMLTDVSPGGQYGATEGSLFLSVFFPRTDDYDPYLPGTWYDSNILYKNEDGDIEWIEIFQSGIASEDDFIFEVHNPPFTDEANEILDNQWWQEVDGTYYTRPNNLQNVDDFLSVWDDAWAEMLVEYHPEFCLYEYCGFVDGDQVSLEFIEQLNEEAYMLETTGSFPVGSILENLTSAEWFLQNDPIWDYQGPQNGELIPFLTETYDPFNDTGIGSETLSEEFLRRIDEFITDQVDGTPVYYSMDNVAGTIGECGTDYVLPSCDMSNGVVNQDVERVALKNFYLGLRSSIILKGSLLYGLYHGCYNECIGNPNELSYYPEITAVLDDVTGSSVCEEEFAEMFMGKERRYGVPAQYYDIPTIMTTTGNFVGNLPPVDEGNNVVQSYTGLCPMEFQITNFIRGLIETESLFGQSSDILLEGQNAYSGFTPAIHDAVNPSALSGDYVLSPSFSSSVLNYSFEIVQTSNITCALSFEIIGDNVSGLDWNDYDPLATEQSSTSWRIEHLETYQYDTEDSGFHKFFLTVSVIGDTGGLDEIVLHVTTCIDLRDDCDDNPTFCEEDGLALEIRELLNALIINNELPTTVSSIGISLADYMYMLENGPIASYLGMEANDLEFKYMAGPTSTASTSTNQFMIGDLTGPDQHYFALYMPSSTSGIGFECSDWTQIIVSAPSIFETIAFNSILNTNSTEVNHIKVDRVTIEGGSPPTINFSQPTLFNCSEDPDCIPEEGDFDPDDIIEMLTYYLNPGSVIIQNGGTLSTWSETLEGTTYSNGLDMSWWTQIVNELWWFDPKEGDDLGWEITEAEVNISTSDTDGDGDDEIVISIVGPGGTTEEGELGCEFVIDVLEDYSILPSNPTQAEEYAGFDATILANNDYEIYPDPNDANSFIFTSSFSGMPQPYQYGAYTYRITSTCVEFTYFGCDECIEQPDFSSTTPLSCNDAYTDYVSTMTANVSDYSENLNTDIYDVDNGIFSSQAEFCAYNLGAQIAAYESYLEQVVSIIQTVHTGELILAQCDSDDPDFFLSLFYVPIEEFVSGYYYESIPEPGSLNDSDFDYYDYLEAIIGLTNNPANLEIFYDLHLTLGDFHSGDYSFYCIEDAIAGIDAQVYESLQDVCSGSDELPNPVVYCTNYQTPTSSLYELITESGVFGDDQETLEDFCAEVEAEFNEQNSAINNETQIQILTQYFLANYIEGAMSSVKEKLVCEGGTSEHHYTLYYYDKVGNLIKTVPPEGVNSYSGVVPTEQTEIEYPLSTHYQYDALNQLVYQKTPDGGETDFYYDRLGRVVASQNAEQADHGHYSYTSYDALGRIKESGQLKAISHPGYTARNSPDFPSDWANMEADSREQVVRTTYDETLTAQIGDYFGDNGQEYLRNRVSTVQYIPHLDAAGDPTGIEHATHYSYDVHGNVKTLIQEIPELEVLNSDVDVWDQSTKRIDYSYDLISGSVTEVAYQSSFADQFYHRYFYDSQNRLTRAATSTDGILWEEDARYYYYAHGPLARTELGHNQAQGLDYAYTLQGWLKGVNSDKLEPTNDIGQDGFVDGERNFITTTDAYGYHLTYFDSYSASGTTFSRDLVPRGDDGSLGNSDYLEAPFAGFTEAGVLPLNSKNLFNGNIARMSSTIYTGDGQPGSIAKLPSLMAYDYDQLNRLVNARAADPSGFDENLNKWSAQRYASNTFGTVYTYDGNGNIQTLLRNGNAPTPLMDNLYYDYYPGTNQLKNVNESVNNSAYDIDIDVAPIVKGAHYHYDAIGNLIEDYHENILIDWFVNGKVKNVNRVTGVANLPDLSFTYGPMGNRVSKLIKTRSGTSLDDEDEWTKTYYVRDAQGNVMATYDRIWNGQSTPGQYTQSDQIRLKGQHMYGSSRLGVRNSDLLLSSREFYVSGQVPNSPYLHYSYSQDIDVTVPNSAISTYLTGVKFFELPNHLGNVLSVVTDNVWAREDPNVQDQILCFDPHIKSATDYYPFGMMMPGRNFSSDDYSYGFNGQERDDEIKGAGNSVNFRFRNA